MITRSFDFKPKPVNPDPDEQADDLKVELELGDRKIQCVDLDKVNGLQLLSYFAAMRSSSFLPGDRTGALVKWLRDVIPASEYPKFEAVCEQYGLEIEDIATIAADLAEVYSARPTMPAESSSAGQSEGGSSSEETSGSEGSTPQG